MSLYKLMIEQARQEIVRRALNEKDGNLTKAAKSLGISRQSVYKILAKAKGVRK